MYRQSFIIGAFATLLLMSSCKSHYKIINIERSRILIDSVYDATQDASAMMFINPYKQKVDSIMGPVAGEIACNMWARKPESNLSNLLADIMVWAGKNYSEHPDFGVYNMGGIRAAFSKGVVTYGDVLDVAPFENKICFLTLTGDKVLELFSQIASVGGEGVSHGVNLVITRDGRLKSVLLNGKEIDPKAKYRIATLDYLAQGNDKMLAFKSKTDVVSPQNEKNNVRYIIVNYFQDHAAKGKAVDSKVEGRIVISE